MGKKTKDETLSKVIKYLISFISFDIQKPHTEVLCRRSMESLGIIFTTNEKIHLIPSEEISIIILDIVNIIDSIIKGMEKNEIVEHMIKNKKEDVPFLWIYLINSLLYKILEPIIFDIKEQIIIDKLIILFNEFLNKDIYKNLNKQYINEIYSIRQEIETSIINFIINNLFKKSLFMENELRNKILLLFKKDSISDDNNKAKDNIISYFPINKLGLNSLFKICEVNKKEEINKDLENISKNLNKNVNYENYSEKYMEARINIAKNSMPLLIEKCKEEMRQYLKNINEKDENGYNKGKIKYILEKLKNLDYIYNEEDEKNYNNCIMKECLKSKKAHLFMLHLILGEFISIQDETIRNIIRDIFKIISNEIGLKKDN